MIDIKYIAECVKRHVVVVILALAAGSVAGAITSHASSGDQTIEPSYTAEATLYVSGFQQTDSGEYNYQLNEGWLSADVRRIILSDSVSGDIRRTLGDDVTISSPKWIEPNTNDAISSHFVYIHASAKNDALAEKAVSLVIEKATPLIKEQLNATEVSLFEGPVAVSSFESASDFGTDPLKMEAIPAAIASINWKQVILFGGMAFIAACALVVIAELFDKKIRCPRDIDRMLGVAVLGMTSPSDSSGGEVMARTTSLIDIRCKENDCRSIFIASMGDSKLAKLVKDSLETNLTYARPVGAGSLSSGVDLSNIHEADGMVLVCEKELDPRSIESAMDYINLSNLPVIGAIYAEGQH